MSQNNRKYGWVPDRPDHRDLKFPEVSASAVLPSKVDLRSGCKAPYDQGDIGSCTANALAGAYQFDNMKEKRGYFTPSRLFIYYWERYLEGSVSSDSGAMIRDGIKVLARYGVCPEIEWKYSMKLLYTKPDANAIKDALPNKILKYLSLSNTLLQMKQCLASGFPFVFGFTVYDSFESNDVARTGMMPMPARSEQELGGHAVLAVGYDDSTQRLIVRNSWGVNWGDKGYFYMPYAYATNSDLCDDFWTIRSV